MRRALIFLLLTIFSAKAVELGICAGCWSSVESSKPIQFPFDGLNLANDLGDGFPLIQPRKRTMSHQTGFFPRHEDSTAHVALPIPIQSSDLGLDLGNEILRDFSILREITCASGLRQSRHQGDAHAHSVSKEFFNGSQFFCVGLGLPSKPHAQDPARRSNTRCDFIEAEIRVFNELSQSCDQRPFSGRFSFLGSFFKNHKSVLSEKRRLGKMIYSQKLASRLLAAPFVLMTLRRLS
jgi:hypothetical protein